MLELKNIRKSFAKGTPDENLLFDNFQLTVPTGQFVSIIGSNGSGKTTMLNLICGNILPDEGRILKDGLDITRQKEHLRGKVVGRVYQDPAMGTASQLTVLENLSIAANKAKGYGLRKGIKKDSEDSFRTLLAPLNMGLENRLHQTCGTLSGGQRQALALLMSTMTHPDVLILDEHTAALDPKSSQTIMELTKQLVDREHFTVLMVTHNLRFAMEYGDRLLMMHEGNIVMDCQGDDKKNIALEDILERFNQISIEVGNNI